MKSWKQQVREFLKATFYGEEKVVKRLKSRKKVVKKGWHYVICKCGHRQGTVIHYGGKNRIPICEPCKNMIDECVDCYVLNLERIKAGQPPLESRMKAYRKAKICQHK